MSSIWRCNKGKFIAHTAVMLFANSAVKTRADDAVALAEELFNALSKRGHIKHSDSVADSMTLEDIPSLVTRFIRENNHLTGV